MTVQSSKFIEKSTLWLKNDVFPLWSEKGIDRVHGGFVESISFEGEVLNIPRRAMVQARQIYSFLTGHKLHCCDSQTTEFAIQQGVQYLLERFSQENGSFAYSVSPTGAPLNNIPDLYTQAFALFGLAQVYTFKSDAQIKERALELVSYLYKERAVEAGGFTELNDKGEVLYRSNPHMHLYEAAIAWMQIDHAPEWKKLGKELTTLCIEKFICPKSHVLAEYFDKNWNPLQENGRFIYEPGHQYEWAWLLSLYEDLTQQDLKSVRHQLFQLAEQHGVSKSRKIVFDEMWSDYTPKTQSSRFWPQCERIKAAVRLGQEVPTNSQALYAQAADEAMETLFNFFKTPMNGTWHDAVSAEDTFNSTSAKASSLYHIINAMDEYIHLRGKLQS